MILSTASRSSEDNEKIKKGLDSIPRIGFYGYTYTCREVYVWQEDMNMNNPENEKNKKEDPGKAITVILIAVILFSSTIMYRAIDLKRRDLTTEISVLEDRISENEMEIEMEIEQDSTALQQTDYNGGLLRGLSRVIGSIVNRILSFIRSLITTILSPIRNIFHI